MQRLATPDEVVCLLARGRTRRSGSRRTRPSTKPAATASCPPTRPPRGAISTNGSSRPRARSPLFSSSTSSRATCSGERSATYKTDPVALMAADRAIERGFDHQVEPTSAVLLPALHALRILRDQERSVTFNEALGERFRRNGPATTTRSSPASAASLIATPSSAARPRPRRSVPARERIQRLDAH